MKIKKILIANRGEIALRIIRTAKEMGIRTVAVYSDLDIHAPHVQYADEAYHIGSAAASESYLVHEKIIETALLSNSDAIHPGYGFLSENAVFAQKVKNAGIIFVGPTPEAIDIMGDKIKAKDAVAKFGVPLVPGTKEPVKDILEIRAIANNIGYPILIKAAAGGGGKGMRVVKDTNELEEQLSRAMSEARSAFGDDRVFIEKYVTAPRHIEFQILADEFGNCVHLFERECSIQRRHQKLVEEAPSSCLTPELREKMGNAAINVAKSCNYTGAGTVEFILNENMEFYFLEMNTRLQVEHPVTELITGIDLVRKQLEIAAGLPLSIRQQDLSIRGHAIELRICAEDPYNNFLPDTGTISSYIRPQGIGIRVDDGVEEGSEISVYYDPMIGKLISYAETRDYAIERLKRAIESFNIAGIKTTLPFGTFVLSHKAFIEGDFDTHFVEKHFNGSIESLPISDDEIIIAAGLSKYFHQKELKTNDLSTSSNQIKWNKRKVY